MAGKPITKEKALERLLSLCSRAEHCEYELTRKLINWQILADERKDILEYLKENRYLDDLRFAKSFANDKARFSSWGPYKIRIELSKRKIKPSHISEALNIIEQKVWKEALLRNAISKAKNLDLKGQDGYENRVRLYRYLIGKGFPSSAASKAVAKLKKIQEDKEV